MGRLAGIFFLLKFGITYLVDMELGNIQTLNKIHCWRGKGRVLLKKYIVGGGKGSYCSFC
jgi:hypothetical protein